MFTDKREDKEDVIYIDCGLYIAIKKIPFSATWMDLEIIILCKASQTKTINYMIPFIHGI